MSKQIHKELSDCIVDKTAEKFKGRHVDGIYFCKGTENCISKGRGNMCDQSPLFEKPMTEVRKDDQ